MSDQPTSIDQVSGAAFPFCIDAATGGVAMSSGSEKIRQNILVILGTRIGERPMLRDFGTRLASLVHDPNDDVLGNLLQTQARQALLQWEPRILVTATQLSQDADSGEARLLLSYIHTTEPVSGQLVIPLG